MTKLGQGLATNRRAKPLRVNNGTANYLRPDGSSQYVRPDHTSTYKRPA